MKQEKKDTKFLIKGLRILKLIDCTEGLELLYNTITKEFQSKQQYELAIDYLKEHLLRNSAPSALILVIQAM